MVTTRHHPSRGSLGVTTASLGVKSGVTTRHHPSPPLPPVTTPSPPRHHPVTTRHGPSPGRHWASLAPNPHTKTPFCPCPLLAALESEEKKKIHVPSILLVFRSLEFGVWSLEFGVFEVLRASAFRGAATHREYSRGMRRGTGCM
jgi:hypothetical protein